MKKSLIVFALTLTITACSENQKLVSSPTEPTAQYSTTPIISEPISWKIDVSAQESKALIDKNQDNPDFVILDIRTAEEYDKYHIPGAVNIDFYKAEDFQNYLTMQDKNKTYLVHCRSGARSLSSMNLFKSLGFTSIYHMNRGINDWNSAGFGS